MSNEQDGTPKAKFSVSAQAEYERLADDLPREGVDTLRSTIEDIARNPTAESETRIKPKTEIDKNTKEALGKLENQPILIRYIETNLHDGRPFNALDINFKDRLLFIDYPEFSVEGLGLKPINEGEYASERGQFTFSGLRQTEQGISLGIKKGEDEIVIPAKYFTLSPSLKKIWGDDWMERAKQMSPSLGE